MGRRSEEELLAEFHRLYDTYAHSEMAWAEVHGEQPESGISREELLEAVERGDVTLTQAIRGIRAGVADATPPVSSHPRDREIAARFLSAYERLAGESFWNTAGKPKARLRLIGARGSIQDADEARFVVAQLADGELSERQRTKANDLLSEFNGSGGGREQSD